METRQDKGVRNRGRLLPREFVIAVLLTVAAVAFIAAALLRSDAPVPVETARPSK